MKAARLHEYGRIELHDEGMPAPADGEALLRVTAVGLCGSDLHWFTHGAIGDARLENPLVLGHEFAARTADGLRVAVDPAIPCGQCEWCEKGHPNLCPTVIFAGHGKQDGALREFMPWPAANLFPLPETISDVEGAMLEPLGVAIHTVNLGKIQPGMHVGVFGCGPIGLLIIQVARLAGANVLAATDILPHRRQAAQKLGVPLVMSSGPEDEIRTISDATGGRGLDVVFEAAGEQDAVDTACGAAMPGGRVVLAGIPDSNSTSFDASVARRKGLTIKLVRRMKNTYPQAIELVSSGKVDVRSLVTHRYPLERVGEAFETARQRAGIKVVIEMEKQP